MLLQRHTLCVCNTTLCNSSPSLVPAGLLLLLSALLLAANLWWGGEEDTLYVFISYLLRVVEVEYTFHTFYIVEHKTMPQAVSVKSPDSSLLGWLCSSVALTGRMVQLRLCFTNAALANISLGNWEPNCEATPFWSFHVWLCLNAWKGGMPLVFYWEDRC